MTMTPGSRYRMYDIVQRYDMPFDRYHVATAFEDDQRVTNTVMRGQVNAMRYAGDDLIVSDILLERAGDAGNSFERHGFRVRPNPWRTYGHGQRLRAYFEIYNLLVPQGRSNYQITYAIREAVDDDPSVWNRLGRAVSNIMGVFQGDPTVSQTFDRQGIGHREYEKIAIDIDALYEGRYRSIVQVEDLTSGEYARSTKVFNKVGGPKQQQTSKN
jgi:hypothetical protein